MRRHLIILLIFGISFTAFGQNDFYNHLSDAALNLTKDEVTYDPSYLRIPYPNGDIEYLYPHNKLIKYLKNESN